MHGFFGLEQWWLKSPVVTGTYITHTQIVRFAACGIGQTTKSHVTDNSKTEITNAH
jgi:hypothetical protein